jgi:hypothetical protein
MIPYSLQERAHFLPGYFICKQNYQQFRDRLLTTGTNVRIPLKVTLAKWAKTFLETDSVADPPRTRKRTDRTAENVQLATELVQDNPHISTRQLSNNLNISQSSAQKILRKDLNLVPYKAPEVQAMTFEDYKNGMLSHFK